MSINNNCIARGVYSHSQTSKFVCVKEYMFIRRDGKKCLVTRFCNETPYTLNSIKILLTELDSTGNVIRKSNLSYRSFFAGPDEVFCAGSGIVVSPKCVDFRITVISATSDKYVFKTRRGRVVTFYNKRAGLKVRRPADKSRPSKTSFRPESPRLAAFLAGVSLILAVGLAIVFVLFDTPKWQDKNDSSKETALVLTENLHTQDEVGVYNVEI